MDDILRETVKLAYGGPILSRLFSPLARAGGAAARAGRNVLGNPLSRAARTWQNPIARGVGREVALPALNYSVLSAVPESTDRITETPGQPQTEFSRSAHALPNAYLGLHAARLLGRYGLGGRGIMGRIPNAMTHPGTLAMTAVPAVSLERAYNANRLGESNLNNLRNDNQFLLSQVPPDVRNAIQGQPFQFGPRVGESRLEQNLNQIQGDTDRLRRDTSSINNQADRLQSPPAVTPPSATPTASPQGEGMPNWLKMLGVGGGSMLGGLALNELFAEEDDEIDPRTGRRHKQRGMLWPALGLGGAALGAGYLTDWQPQKLLERNWWTERQASYNQYVKKRTKVAFLENIFPVAAQTASQMGQGQGTPAPQPLPGPQPPLTPPTAPTTSSGPSLPPQQGIAATLGSTLAGINPGAGLPMVGTAIGGATAAMDQARGGPAPRTAVPPATQAMDDARNVHQQGARNATSGTALGVAGGLGSLAAPGGGMAQAMTQMAPMYQAGAREPTPVANLPGAVGAANASQTHQQTITGINQAVDTIERVSTSGRINPQERAQMYNNLGSLFQTHGIPGVLEMTGSQNMEQALQRISDPSQPMYRDAVSRIALETNTDALQARGFWEMMNDQEKFMFVAGLGLAAVGMLSMTMGGGGEDKGVGIWGPLLGLGGLGLAGYASSQGFQNPGNIPGIGRFLGQSSDVNSQIRGARTPQDMSGAIHAYRQRDPRGHSEWQRRLNPRDAGIVDLIQTQGRYSNAAPAPGGSTGTPPPVTSPANQPPPGAPLNTPPSTPNQAIPTANQHHQATNTLRSLGLDPNAQQVTVSGLSNQQLLSALEQIQSNPAAQRELLRRLPDNERQVLLTRIPDIVRASPRAQGVPDALLQGAIADTRRSLESAFSENPFGSSGGNTPVASAPPGPNQTAAADLPGAAINAAISTPFVVGEAARSLPSLGRAGTSMRAAPSLAGRALARSGGAAVGASALINTGGDLIDIGRAADEDRLGEYINDFNQATTARDWTEYPGAAFNAFGRLPATTMSISDTLSNRSRENSRYNRLRPDQPNLSPGSAGYDQNARILQQQDRYHPVYNPEGRIGRPSWWSRLSPF